MLNRDVLSLTGRGAWDIDGKGTLVSKYTGHCNTYEWVLDISWGFSGRVKAREDGEIKLRDALAVINNSNRGKIR